jgi:hypothetical protein
MDDSDSEGQSSKEAGLNLHRNLLLAVKAGILASRPGLAWHAYIEGAVLPQPGRRAPVVWVPVQAVFDRLPAASRPARLAEFVRVAYKLVDDGVLSGRSGAARAGELDGLEVTLGNALQGMELLRMGEQAASHSVKRFRF